MLAEVREAAAGDPDIFVLELAADSHLDINALQRAATVVLLAAGPAKKKIFEAAARGENRIPAGRLKPADIASGLGAAEAAAKACDLARTSSPRDDLVLAPP